MDKAPAERSILEKSTCRSETRKKQQEIFQGLPLLFEAPIRADSFTNMKQPIIGTADGATSLLREPYKEESEPNTLKKGLTL